MQCFWIAGQCPHYLGHPKVPGPIHCAHGDGSGSTGGLEADCGISCRRCCPVLHPITLTRQLLTSSGSFWISSNHPFHLHTTSKIHGTKFPCLNLVVINFQPWTLPIVKSHLLFFSDPASLCLLFMYTLPCCVFFAPLLSLPLHLLHF